MPGAIQAVVGELRLAWGLLPPTDHLKSLTQPLPGNGLETAQKLTGRSHTPYQTFSTPCVRGSTGSLQLLRAKVATGKLPTSGPLHRASSGVDVLGHLPCIFDSQPSDRKCTHSSWPLWSRSLTLNEAYQGRQVTLWTASPLPELRE